MKNSNLFDVSSAPFMGIDADITDYRPRRDGRTFIMQAGVMTAPRVLTISTRDAKAGDPFEVIDQDSSVNTLSVQAGLESYALRAFEGVRYHLRYVFNGTAWLRLDETIMPRLFRRVVGPDANHIFSIDDGNFVVATTVSASRVWAFNLTSAVRGHTIDVFNSTSAFPIVVHNNAAATIATVQSFGGFSRSARIVFDPDGTGDWVTTDLADTT